MKRPSGIALTLPLSALLLGLGGCATQQAAGPDPADTLNQRMSNLEGVAGLAWDQGKTTQARLNELGQKVDILASELAQLRQGQSAADQRDLASVEGVSARLTRAEQRLAELAGQSRDTAQQAAELRAALPGLRSQMEGSLPPVSARVDAAEQRLAGLERRLEGIASSAEASAAQAAALGASVPGLEARFGSAASRVNDLDARLARIEKRLEEIYAMAQDALDATGQGQRRIVGKVVHTVVLTDDKTLFPINSPTLGDKDMAKLNELAARVKAMGTWFHLQIQGHTDGFGSEDYNYELGRARAEVVKAYLNEKGGIPLLRMSVISHGASEAASYATKSNRRIVINVLQ